MLFLDQRYIREAGCLFQMGMWDDRKSRVRCAVETVESLLGAETFDPKRDWKDIWGWY